MKLPTASLLAPLLLAGASAAQAQSEADLLRCLDVADAGARLACFDRNAQALRAARAGGQAPATVPDPAQREASFGKTERPAADSLSSQIVGEFGDWERNSRIKLANGQVWQIIDAAGNTGRPLKDPKVTIRSGFMGSSYFMTVEGVSFQIKVRRVQ